MILLNPKKMAKTYPDKETRDIMQKTIDFFENMGLRKCKEDYYSAKWYTEFFLKYIFIEMLISHYRCEEENG